jgi:hypothetical protein
VDLLVGVQDFIRAHRVVIGMKADDVRRAWGEPGKKSQLEGVASERWSYGKRSVTLEHGVVTRVQN